MKPATALLAVTLMFAAMFPSAPARAEEKHAEEYAEKFVEDYVEEFVKVYVDSERIAFDVQPILEEGTTLVQFRPIFEKLGLVVDWDPKTRTVTGKKAGLEITLVIDEQNAYVNGELKQLELAPRLVEGNTFVPLRFVGEASGKNVKWDGDTFSVYIDDPVVKGKFVYPNGDNYEGELKGGYPEGRGKLTDREGRLLFEGTMRGGVPFEGRLKRYYENGKTEFDGYVINGVENGPGKQYARDGRLLFEGTFENGQRANGTLYDDNGGKYTGPFDNDLPNGTGKIVYRNGDVYEGNVVDGVREGAGTFTAANGEKLVGEFHDDRLNGIVYHYDRRGTLLSISEFSGGVLVRRVDVAPDNDDPLPDTNPDDRVAELNQEKERHARAVAEIKERYDENRKKIEEQIAQIRKDTPGVYPTRAAYERALREAENKQKELSDRLNALSGDNSRAAEAARAELTKQLAEIGMHISQIHAKGAAQAAIDGLKEQLSALRSEYNAQLKQENDFHASRIKQIGK
jgi:antitoxin component YwqK of YwqJK toxin-antitoxin module